MPKQAHNRHTPETFWARVDVRGPEECWLWTGCRNKAGYGTLSYGGEHALAPRVAAFIEGLVPAVRCPEDRKGSGFVLHSCDNPPCCNPAHFEIGTLSKNQADAYGRGLKRQPKGQRHANAKLTDVEAAEIVRRYNAGESQDGLARVYQVSQMVVSLIIRGKTYLTAGAPRRTRVRQRPRRQPCTDAQLRRLRELARARAKLAPLQVEDIRRRYAVGDVGYRTLARTFDVSFAQIRNIVKGRSRGANPHA